MPVTNYIWDVVSDNVLMEKDDDGETIARYVQEPELYGEVISQERGGQSRYYHYDGEGNTSELTDENENVTDTFEYSAFGEEVARTGTTENPFGYKGALGYYANGETNDIYVRARTYEPTTGRWLVPDPLNFFDGSNRYRFCYNAPVTFTDPSGLCVCVVLPPGIQLGPPRRQVLMGNLDGFYGMTFTSTVSFAGNCGCCEFRQFVKGWGARFRYIDPVTNLAGRWTYVHPFGIGVIPDPIGTLFFREDCTSGRPPLRRSCYGYRNQPSTAGDAYTKNQATGCKYDMEDSPGIGIVKTLLKHAPRNELQVEINNTFHQIVVDTCSIVFEYWPDHRLGTEIIASKVFEVRDSVVLGPLFP